VSPKGGESPVDGFDLTDQVNAEFWNDRVYHTKITQAKKPSESESDTEESGGIPLHRS